MKIDERLTEKHNEEMKSGIRVMYKTQGIRAAQIFIQKMLDLNIVDMEGFNSLHRYLTNYITKNSKLLNELEEVTEKAGYGVYTKPE